MVKDDSGIKALPDLAGKKIGIAGGPLDKSWLILRAYARQQHDMDLAAETEQVFGAPPLIFKSALSGETAGTINFWHFLAKMRAKGMHELVSVSDAAAALKLDPDTPLLGYVLKGEYAATHPEIVKGLYKASRAAKDLLRENDEVWEELRDKMNAAEMLNSLPCATAIAPAFRAASHRRGGRRPVSAADGGTWWRRARRQGDKPAQWIVPAP